MQTHRASVVQQTLSARVSLCVRSSAPRALRQRSITPGLGRRGQRASLGTRSQAADSEPTIVADRGDELETETFSSSAVLPHLAEMHLYTRPSTEEELDALRGAYMNPGDDVSAATKIIEFEHPEQHFGVCELLPGVGVQTVKPGPTFRAAHCAGCVAVAVQFRWVRLVT